LYSANEENVVKQALAVVEKDSQTSKAPRLLFMGLGMLGLFSIGGVAVSVYMKSERQDLRRPRYIEVSSASDEEPLMADMEGPLE